MGSSYTYRYDSEGESLILVDRESGREISREGGRVLDLLAWLQRRGEGGLLRRYCIWCARRMSPAIKPVQQKLLRAAEAEISGKARPGLLATLYEETEGMAVATDTVGLRKGDAGAAAFLSTRECVNPDAYEGALRCTQYLSIWKAGRQPAGTGDHGGRGEQTGPEDMSGTAGSRPGLWQGDQQEVDFLLDLAASFSI